MNRLIQLLFPERVKRETMTSVYDEMVIGISICETIKDINNVHDKIQADFFQFQHETGYRDKFNSLLNLLGKQTKHILNSTLRTK